MKAQRDVAERLAGRLERLGRAIQVEDVRDVPVTVISVVRHGYAATRVSLESAYANTGVKFLMLYLDVASPEAARRYLEEQARSRRGFHHLRVDDHVSRQTARLLVLDLVPTRYTVFVDNNMLFGPGWLERLLETAEDPVLPADVVSPVIVMQGGRMHFSGSVLIPEPDGTIARSQNTSECPLASRLEEVRPRKMEIDFGESHCCLLRTDGFRDVIPEVFPERMHNAHTLGFATYLLKTRHGQRMVVEPRSLVSILPIGAGYDIPWIFESYMDLEGFKQSYGHYGSEIGKGVSTTLGNLAWHRKHLMYMLLSMLERDHLERQTLLEPHEVPAYVDGYDLPLTPDAVDLLRRTVGPFVKARYPRYAADLAFWLDPDVDPATDVDGAMAALGHARAALQVA